MTNLTQMLPEQISMCALYQTYSRQVHSCDWKEIDPQHHDLTDFENWLFEAQQQACEPVEAPPEEQVKIVEEMFWEMLSHDEPFEDAAATLGLILMKGGPNTDYGTIIERLDKMPMIDPIPFPYYERETRYGQLTDSPQVWSKHRHHKQWVATGNVTPAEDEELPQHGEIIMANIPGRESTAHEVQRYAGQDEHSLPLLLIKPCKTQKNDVRQSLVGSVLAGYNNTMSFLRMS